MSVTYCVRRPLITAEGTSGVDDEWLVRCDERGVPIGRERRSVCHRNSQIIHAVAHVTIVNSAGAMLLQKRSPAKDVEPGRWDTAVGGHLRPGEEAAAAAHREMREELGIAPARLAPAYQYLIRTRVESEFVHSFESAHDGPFAPDPEEITEVRFWSAVEIASALGRGVFTPNFEEEYRRWRIWKAPATVARQRLR